MSYMTSWEEGGDRMEKGMGLTSIEPLLHARQRLQRTLHVTCTVYLMPTMHPACYVSS